MDEILKEIIEEIYGLGCENSSLFEDDELDQDDMEEFIDRIKIAVGKGKIK